MPVKLDNLGVKSKVELPQNIIKMEFMVNLRRVLIEASMNAESANQR